MSYQKKFVKLTVLGGRPQKAEHVKLVVGEYRKNPHVRVLCPELRRWGRCYKNHRPKLLLKNHMNPRRQLWQCDGSKKCSNKDFLIVVEYLED